VVDLLAKGENAKAAELFVETIAMGEGAWKQLPPEARETFVYNAPTFYDETNDPLSLEIDLEALSAFDKPALLSNGTKSAPFFPMVINKLVNVLPNARRITIEGAGHVPHMSHPKEYVDLVQRFCLSYS
jgi:pimeloyl-ACP methyl ester carboxylesterase